MKDEIQKERKNKIQKKDEEEGIRKTYQSIQKEGIHTERKKYIPKKEEEEGIHISK